MQAEWRRVSGTGVLLTAIEHSYMARSDQQHGAGTFGRAGAGIARAMVEIDSLVTDCKSDDDAHCPPAEQESGEPDACATSITP
jgi:hypothetical protein